METIIFTPDDGYEIDKVTVNGIETGVLSNVLDVTMDADKTVYAKWTEVKKDNPTNPTTPTNPTKPADPTTPQTGDNSNMFLWIALLFVNGGALVGTTVYGRKKKYFRFVFIVFRPPVFYFPFIIGETNR